MFSFLLRHLSQEIFLCSAQAFRPNTRTFWRLSKVITNSRKVKEHLPAHIRSIADVSGAGDTVISVAALCRALECNDIITAAIANLSGGLVCEQIGVVPVNKEQLLEEALKLDFVR